MQPQCFHVLHDANLVDQQSSLMSCLRIYGIQTLVAMCLWFIAEDSHYITIPPSLAFTNAGPWSACLLVVCRYRGSSTYCLHLARVPVCSAPIRFNCYHPSTP
jgi:hypothetical protein